MRIHRSRQLVGIRLTDIGSLLFVVASALVGAPRVHAQAVFGKEATVPKRPTAPIEFRMDNTGATSFGFFDGDPKSVDADYVIAVAGGAQIWFGDYYMTARNFLIWTDSPANSSRTREKPTFPYAPIDPVATGAGVAKPALDNLKGASLLPGIDSASTSIGQLREIYAEGDVYIEQRSASAKNIFQATRAYFNVIEDRSLIIQGELRTDLKSAGSLTGKAATGTTTDATAPPVPIVFRAAEIRGVAKGLFEADNAQLTTCTFAEPGYHIAVDHLIYEQRATELSGRVTGMGNQLVIQDQPLIALPYLEIRTGADSPFPLIGADFGGSSKLGFFIKTRWGNVFEQAGIDFNNSLGIQGEFTGKWWVDINWYSLRGLGLGGGVAYETTVTDPLSGKKKPKYVGSTEFFFINDISGDDQVGKVDQSGFRSRFKTLNRVYLPDEWRLDTELYYVSDENFLREFFDDSTSYQDTFKKEKEPETVAYLRKLSGDTAVTSTLRYRLNTWQTQTEYLPQATYDVISRPIAEFDTLGEALGRPDALRLYWTHRTEVAFVNRLVSDQLESSDSALDAFENDLSSNPDTTGPDDPVTSPFGNGKSKKGKKKPSFLAGSSNDQDNQDTVPGDDLDPTVKQTVRSNDPFLDARERQFRAEGSAVRIDDIERFNLPFELGPIGIDPYFENRLTYWLGDAEIDGGGGMREGMTIGFNASTQFWKTIPDFESEFFNIHGLRHILIPNVRYRYTFFSTRDSNDLVPYDAVERYDTLHAIVPGLRSRYQTKRLTRYGRETTTFLDIDIQQPYVFENGRQEGLANLLEEEQGNRQLNEFEKIDDGTGFGDFWVDVRYRPDIDYYLLRRSSLRSTLAWNLQDSQLDQYRIEFQTEPGPDFYARVAYSYAQAANVSPSLALDGFLLNRESSRSLNSLKLEFAYQLTRRWEFAIRDEIDLPTVGIGDLSLMLRRRTHDWLFEFRLGAPGGGGGFGVSVRPLAFAKRSERDRYKTALSDGYDLTPLFDIPDYSEGPALQSSEETQNP